jgi:leucyl aminopeptidase (aminopeptidase T)
MKWAKNVVRTCMNIKAGEKVQVWVDEPLIRQGLVLVGEIKDVGAETLLVVFPDSIRPIKKFPETLSATSRETDVLIWWLNKLVSDTETGTFILPTIPKFTGDGARIGFGVFIDDDMLENEMSADYTEISKRTEKLANLINGGKDVHIAASGGTDIKFSIKGRRCLADSGFIHQRGIFRNLPAGEVCLAPLEESANGVVVFDKSIILAERGMLKTPITLHFRNGRVAKIEGGEEAVKLRKAVKEAGKGADVIAELGIGTNDRARLMGNPMTDEKVLGTAHIAIGDNVHIPLGGKNEAKIHIDGIIGEPTIVVDGKTVMTKGKFIFL